MPSGRAIVPAKRAAARRRSATPVRELHSLAAKKQRAAEHRIEREEVVAKRLLVGPTVTRETGGGSPCEGAARLAGPTSLSGRSRAGVDRCKGGRRSA